MTKLSRPLGKRRARRYGASLPCESSADCAKLDIVARYDENTFTALLRGVAKVEDATLVATDLIASLSKPIPVSGSEVLLAVYVGIAIALGTEEDVEELQTVAQKALVKSRRQGPGQFSIAVV